MLFPSQKAFCFRLPDLDKSEKDLFPPEQIHPVFQKQMGDFRDYVLSREPKAGISGEVLCSRLQRFVGALSRDRAILLNETFQRAWWGGWLSFGRDWHQSCVSPPPPCPVLASLAESYVGAIRNKEVPCIENAVLALAQLENVAAVREAVQRYDEMEELMRPMLPTEDVASLLVAHSCCEEEALRVFMGRAFRDEGQHFQKQLADQLQGKLGELCRRNEGASLDRCQAILMELYQEVEDNVVRGHYLQPGGYQRFLSDRQSVVEWFHQAEDKGLMAAKALQDFLASKEETAQSILQADQTLQEKEKELEVEKARAEAAQREAQLQREMQERAEQMAREKERSFEEHKKQLMAKMEQERRTLLAEQERLLHQRLQEQTRLQQEGFHREVSRMQGEIQGLRHQIQDLRSCSGGGGICTIL
nr:guanylate-binding protein 1-like [Anolis sagrei ordinatus]